MLKKLYTGSYVGDFDIIMIFQTITVSVCSSLLHDKITWLRFENESDTKQLLDEVEHDIMNY